MTKGKIKEGKIVQVIGPVIDIEFEEGDLPTLYNAVKLTNTRISDKEGNLIAEVAQHIGENTVRCVCARACLVTYNIHDLFLQLSFSGMKYNLEEIQPILT